MVLSYNSKILTAGSNILSIPESFVINVNGTKFPQVILNNLTATFTLGFSVATKVSIDYGNGVTIVYDTIEDSGVHYFSTSDVGSSSTQPPPVYAIGPYVYPDGVASDRIVSISFDKNLLVEVDLVRHKFIIGDLRFEFAKYPNLKRFVATQVGSNTGSIVNLNLLNASLSSHLTSFNISQTFHSTSPYYEIIPLEVLNMPLTLLGVGTPHFPTDTFANTNMDKIVNCKSTLTNLIILGVAFTDNNFGDGPLPSNFNQLTNLSTIRITGTSYTTIPPVLLALSSLTNITIAAPSATTIGNISALVNLTSLTMDGATLGSTLPTGLISTINLKTWSMATLGHQGGGVLDAFITNFYNFVVANAAMTGASSLPFRGMIMNVKKGNGNSGDIPSGTYQQPTGYVQGSSNGTPASSREMIWVLTNQYGHVWTYSTT